jgi:hypothetical protein
MRCVKDSGLHTHILLHRNIVYLCGLCSGVYKLFRLLFSPHGHMCCVVCRPCCFNCTEECLKPAKNLSSWRGDVFNVLIIIDNNSLFTIYLYKRTSTYELSRNDQFEFTNFARTNKLRLKVHLTNTAPSHKHFNKLTLTDLRIYLM